VELHDHHFDAALAAFDAAEELIGDHLEEMGPAAVDLWLELQLDGRANVYSLLNEPDKMAPCLDRARPVVEARGSVERRLVFLSMSTYRRGREARWRIDEQMLADMRAAVALAPAGR